MALCSAVLALLAVASTAYKTPENNGSAPLMGIHVSGNSSYEIGRKIGESVKDQLKELLLVDTTLEDYLIPWLEANPDIYAAYYALNSQTFPDQFSELEGFCDATGMNLTHLVLLMLRPEIQGLLAEQGNASDVLEHTENCFDVIANPATEGLGLVIGHNEDWATQYGRFGYLIYVAQTHSAAAAREIATYSYPASSLGFTFGWNSDGLVVSCNGITPLHPNAGGYGRYFINRAVLEARSLEDAVARLEKFAKNASYGFGVTLASTGGGEDPVHIEVGPKAFSKKVIGRGQSFVHTNRFSHEAMSTIEQTIGPSTRSRFARAQEFERIETEQDVRDILGDTKNASYPMYRTGAAPDTGATLVTAVFDVEALTVTIYNTNPKDTDPLMVIPIYKGGKGGKEHKEKNVYMDIFWPVVAVAVVAVAFAIVGFVLYFRKSSSSERAFKDPLLN